MTNTIITDNSADVNSESTDESKSDSSTGNHAHAAARESLETPSHIHDKPIELEKISEETISMEKVDTIINAAKGAAQLKFLGSSSGKNERLDESNLKLYERDLPSDYRRMKCPEETASWLSYLTFWWLNPMIALGNKQVLEETDMYELREDMESAKLSQQFHAEWEKQKQQATEAGDINQASVLKTLSKLHGKLFWAAGMAQLASSLLNFAQPLLLEQLLNFLTQFYNKDPNTPPLSRGYLIIVAMFICPILNSILQNVYSRICWGIGVTVRTQLIAAMYHKSLKLTPAARAEMNTGRIVNMMASDTGRLEMVCAWYHNGQDKHRSSSPSFSHFCVAY
jgi:hypothetical protein